MDGALRLGEHRAVIRGLLPSGLERNLPRIRWGLHLVFTVGFLLFLVVQPELPPEARPLTLVLLLRAVILATAFYGIHVETTWGRGFALGTLIDAVLPFGLAVSAGVFFVPGLFSLDVLAGLLLLDEHAARMYEGRARHEMSAEAVRRYVFGAAACGAMLTFSFGGLMILYFFAYSPPLTAALLGAGVVSFVALARRDPRWVWAIGVTAVLQIVLLVLIRT